MIISADAQIGFLRDCVEGAEQELADSRSRGDYMHSADASMVLANFQAILATVVAVRDLYDNRQSDDPIWLSRLFQAVAPVAK